VDERESGEISRLSKDKVFVAILAHIVDTGGCTVGDLENLDAVVRETEAVMQSLLASGIIEENGELKITEKGRNLLKTLEVCEAILEAEHNPDDSEEVIMWRITT
jgi:predicted transcriptional regulator